jgi:methylthioribulose-1-phosphate dehydratase
VDKGNLADDDLLLVGADGRAGDGSKGRPSAECALHVQLAEQAGASAILHTHSVWGTLVGERFAGRGGFHLTGYEMLKALRGVRSHEDDVFVPVIANSQDMDEIGEPLGRWIAGQPELCGFLIAGHGLYAWGRDLDEAYRHVEGFEFLFELVGRRLALEPFSGNERP